MGKSYSFGNYYSPKYQVLLFEHLTELVNEVE